VTGNVKTFGKMALLDLYLKQFGINPKRVYYTQISASECAELTEVVEEFVHILKEIGPNPIKKGA
jgi:coenzyme F420-reducing hydrogenase delta subunit